MNARALVADLKERNVRLVACGDSLIVDAPTGVMTAPLLDTITASKSEILATLSGNEDLQPAKSLLVEYAAAALPSIKFTVIESGDQERDFSLLHRIRAVINEYQPGGNRVRMRIVTTDGRPVTVEWRALAERGLRLEIGRILATSSPRRANGTQQ